MKFFIILVYFFKLATIYLYKQEKRNEVQNKSVC